MLGASETTRSDPRGSGAVSSFAQAKASSARMKTKTRPGGRVMNDRMGGRLRLAAFLIFHVVGDAEAGAGRGIHLLGRVDGVLQFCDPILHLCQLLFVLVFEFAH